MTDISDITLEDKILKEKLSELSSLVENKSIKENMDIESYKYIINKIKEISDFSHPKKKDIDKALLMASFLLPEQYADTYMKFFLGESRPLGFNKTLYNIYYYLTGAKKMPHLYYNTVFHPENYGYEFPSISIYNKPIIPISLLEFIKRLQGFYQKFHNKFSKEGDNDNKAFAYELSILEKEIPVQEERERQREEKKRVCLVILNKNVNQLKRELNEDKYGLIKPIPDIDDFTIFILGLYLLPSNEYSKYLLPYFVLSYNYPLEAVQRFIQIIHEHYLDYKMYFLKLKEDYRLEKHYWSSFFEHLRLIIEYIHKASHEKDEPTKKSLETRYNEIVENFNTECEKIEHLRETPCDFRATYEMFPGQPRPTALNLYYSHCGQFKGEKNVTTEMKEFLRKQGHDPERLTFEKICKILYEYGHSPVTYYFY